MSTCIYIAINSLFMNEKNLVLINAIRFNDNGLVFDDVLVVDIRQIDGSILW